MHFPPTGLVQYIYFRSVPEGCFAIYQDNIHVLYKAIIADVVIGYIVLNVLYNNVVANLTIVDDGIVYTGVFF